MEPKIYGRDFPKEGDIFRHFKGNVYEVIVPMAISTEIHSDLETEYWVTVYKDFNKGKFFTRHMLEFMSKIDRDKYPDNYLDKEFRFEFLINKNDKKFTEKYQVDNLLPSIIYDGIKIGYKGFEKYISDSSFIAKYIIEKVLAFGIPKPNFLLVENLDVERLCINYGIGEENLTFKLPILKKTEIFEEAVNNGIR